MQNYSKSLRQREEQNTYSTSQIFFISNKIIFYDAPNC
jgi:hypothetical protein